jgi:hypothetical protein
VTRLAAAGRVLVRREDLRPVERLLPALFFETERFRAGAPLRAEPFFVVALRAVPRFRALERLRADVLFRLPRDADPAVRPFRPVDFRAELLRLREPVPPFLPPLEPPRDDFLAAAMI